ncbi:MAG: hypothetical protein OXF98_01455 [Rhodospirillaceae bacterium]|nr:hypothetical protein [Rhodospirillaceae bacterium]
MRASAGADAVKLPDGEIELAADPGVGAGGVHRRLGAAKRVAGQHDAAAHRQLLHQHAPALPGHPRAADDGVQRHEHVGAPGRPVLEGDVEGEVAAADFDPLEVRRNQCGGDAVLVALADEVLGIIELEGEPQHRRDGRERDVALLPVEPDTDDRLALELAPAHHAAVGDRGGIGARPR